MINHRHSNGVGKRREVVSARRQRIVRAVSWGLSGCVALWILVTLATSFQRTSNSAQKTSQHQKQQQHMNLGDVTSIQDLDMDDSGHELPFTGWRGMRDLVAVGVLTSAKTAGRLPIFDASLGHRIPLLAFLSDSESVPAALKPDSGLVVDVVHQKDSVLDNLQRRRLLDANDDKANALLGLVYLYRKFPTANWFYLTDDNTYTLLDNLALFLESQSEMKPWFIGSRRRDNSGSCPDASLYLSAGAGVLVSRSLMERMVPLIPQCLAETCSQALPGDVQLSRCVSRTGFEPIQNDNMHFDSVRSVAASSAFGGIGHLDFSALQRPITFNDLDAVQMAALAKFELVNRKVPYANPGSGNYEELEAHISLPSRAESPPITVIQPEDTIFLKFDSVGKFLDTEDGHHKVQARYKDQGDWQTVHIEAVQTSKSGGGDELPTVRGGATVVIRTWTGRLLECSDTDNKLTNTKKQRDSDHQLFVMEAAGDSPIRHEQKLHLKNVGSGKYVGVRGTVVTCQDKKPSFETQVQVLGDLKSRDYVLR